jgi:hypothetical protein
MRSLRWQPIALAAISLAACRTTETARSLPAGPIQTEPGGASGYQHGWERSRFGSESARGKPSRVEENGFSKVVTADGVFAVQLRNGLAIGVSGGGTDKGGKASGTPATADRNVMDPDKHNDRVLDYFLAAGVPRAQVGAVHATTYLSSTGSASEAHPAPPQVDGYASILERVVEGHAVVDSVAWARMSDQGRVLSEWVYWPAIPARALAEARRLDEVLKDPERASYMARLPAGLPKGKVVIRHSSGTVDAPFEAFASYDVVDRKVLSEGVDGREQERQTVSVVVRHFDVEGNERRLPQEERHLSADTPGKETAKQ